MTYTSVSEQDFGLTETDLVLKYKREHPTYTRHEYDLSESQTHYWAWVVSSINFEEYCWAEAVAAGRSN
jgi:hypothetical protein